MRLEPDLLRRVPAFAALPTGACEALAICFRERHYVAGDVIFREGDPATSMFLVATGELTLTAPMGAIRHARRVGPGQLVGEDALIDPAPRWGRAEATRASTVFEIGDDALETLRRAAPEVACALVGAAIAGVARRLRQLERRVERELERGGTPS
jgi:CRP-like cAMP-binding protein